MELTTPEPLPSSPRFCLRARPFQYRQEEYEVVLRPRKGSAAVCSRPFASTRIRPTRRAALRVYRSVGILRLPAVRDAARRLPPLWRGGRRRSPWGDGKRTLTKA